jgi:DNA-binding response OmpR family regulator
MKALICIPDPEEEIYLHQVLRLANIVASAKKDLTRVIDEWSEHPAEIVIVAAKPSEIIGVVVAIRAVTSAILVVVVDPPREDNLIELYVKGADLVVLRPYSCRLLRVQIETLLRRSTSMPLTLIPILYDREIALEPSTRTARRSNDAMIAFTRREFQLLHLLFVHRGQTLTNEQIIESIWGYSGEGDTNMLRSLVNRVRKKLEEEPNHPQHLVSVPGVGYQFRTR